MKYILFFCLTAFLIPSESGLVWETIVPRNDGELDHIRSLEFSSDGELILVDSWETIHILRAEDGEILHTVNSANWCSFDASGNNVYFIKSKSVWKLDLNTYESEELFTLVNGAGEFPNYSFDKTKLVISLSTRVNEVGQLVSRGLDIYDINSGQIEKHIDHWIPSIYGFLSHDNKYLSWQYLNTLSNGEIDAYGVLYNLETDQEIEHSKGVKAYRFHPYKEQFMTNESNQYIIKDFQQTVIKSLQGYDIKVLNNKSWTKDGDYFTFIDSKGKLTLLDSETYSMTNKSEKLLNERIYDVNINTEKIIFGNDRVRSFDISGVLSVENDNVFQLSINPNPVQNQLNISYNLIEPTHLELFITDLLGNQVDLVQSGFIENSNQNISFPIPHLSNGTYFLTLNANNINESVQFVKE